MKKRFTESECGVCGSKTPLACTHKVDHHPSLQRDLDAGHDIDISGVVAICRNTLQFRKGSGRLIGDGLIQSNAHPILHATDDYEHTADLASLRLRGVEIDPGAPTDGFTDEPFLKPRALS